MPDILAKITQFFLKFLKLDPRYLISLAIITAFLLFSPEKLLKPIGIYDFAQNYRQWFGLIFLVSIVLFSVDRSIPVIAWVKHKMAVAKFSKNRLQKLHCLTEEEKQILRFYILNETKSNTLRVDDGVVQGLVSAGIIYRSASLGNMSEGFAHNITDFAWDYLNKNQTLLDGTTNIRRTDKQRGFLR